MEKNFILPEEVLFEEVVDDCLEILNFSTPDPPYYYDCACHSFYLYLTGDKEKAYKILKSATYDDFKNLFYNLSVQDNVPYLKLTLKFLHESLNIENIFDPKSYQPLTKTIEEDNNLFHSDAHLFSQNLYNAKRFDDSKKIFLLLNEQSSLFITAKFLGKNNDYDMLEELYEATQSQYFLAFMYQILYKKKEEEKSLDILSKIITQNSLIIIRKFLIMNKQNTKEINELISKYKENIQINEKGNEKIHTFAICQSISHALSLYENNKKIEAAEIFRLFTDEKSCLIIGSVLFEHLDEATFELLPNNNIYDAYRYCIAYKTDDEFEAFQDMLGLEYNLGAFVCADFLLDQNQLNQSLSIGKQLDPFGKQFIEGDEYTSHYARHLYMKGYRDEAMEVWKNGKYPSRGLSFLIAVKDDLRIRRIIDWSSNSEKPVCGMKLYRNDINYKDYIIDFFQYVTGEKNVEAMAEFLLSFNEVEGIQFLYNKTGNEFYLQKLAQFTFDKGNIDDALSMFDSLYYEDAIFQGAKFLFSKDKLEESILLIKKTTTQEKIEEFVELLYKNDHHRKAFELFSSLDDDNSICSAAIFLLYQNNFEQSRILYQQIRDEFYMFKYGRILLKFYDDLAYHIFINLQSDKILNKAAKVIYEKDKEKSYNIFKLIKTDQVKRRYAKFLYNQGKASDAMEIFTSLNDEEHLNKSLWFLLSVKNYEGATKVFEKFKTYETPAAAWYLTWLYENGDREKAKTKFSQIQKHEYPYWHDVRPITFLIQKGEFEIAKLIFSRMKNVDQMSCYIVDLYNAGKKEEALKAFYDNYTKSEDIVLHLANGLSTLTGEDDKVNYANVKKHLTSDKCISQHGNYLLNKKKVNEALEMFRKIKGRKYGSKATFSLFNIHMDDVCKEFHQKFPSSEIYRIMGVRFYNGRKYEESWEQFNLIQDQKEIIQAAEFLLFKNEFEKAVILFRKYHGDMDSKLALRLAIEFHKREMFEDANFYYHLSNNYQAKNILSKCFRENTVGAFKKPKTFQKVFFSLKHKKVNVEDDDISVSTSSDLSHLEELEDIDQQVTKKIANNLKKAEKYYSKASETYNALSVIYSFIPLILSLVRLIQSCSITVSESSIHFVDNFINFFEWSTKLFNIVAFDWFKFSPIDTEQSILILTFLCTYLLSLLSISLNNGYRSLLACFVNSIIFIPIGIGLDLLPSTLGICLFSIFIVLYVIVTFFVMKFVKNPIPRYIVCNYLGEKINESKLKIRDENKHFGWFSDKKHISDHVYINMNLSLLIPLVIFILISFGILRTNNLLYLIIAICVVIYIVCIILEAKLKKRIFTFMQIVGNFVAYFSMIVGQLMLIPFIEMLTENDDGEKLNKTVIIFASAFSIIFPFVSIIVSCIHIYKMIKTQNPFFIRIWLLNSYSSSASLCSELKLSAIFWPIFDFGYHIVYAVVNTFGKSIVNIILASIVIILTLIIRPYFLISQNILYISEPIVILFLNILIYVNDIKKPIEISIGYVLIAVALVPIVFSILFYWIYEKRRDHEFHLMMKEINDPRSCCCSYRKNALTNPFSTDELNKKIFYEPKTKLYHELFRNEQNYAESVKTDTTNPESIPDVHFIKKKVDPISLHYGDILNKIIIGPGMIFTASAISYMIRK